jgi:tRNA threonylcarbamoyladenosine biosynthesis protein TsaE
MNTVQTWQTVSTSSSNTLELALKIGVKLRGGEVIELVSDLGGGKTTFVRGLARGIGSQDHVHSPSFTLANEYVGPQLKLFHLDLYRLNATGILSQELSEFINEPASVVVVEWPNLIESLLPDDRLSISITPIGKNSRQFIFKYPSNLSYLLHSNT